MKISELVFRSWYYFRLGYSTYLSFPVGYVSILVTIYYLAIQNIPDLKSIFPRFALFILAATIIGAPVSVAIGWMHVKKTKAMKSELDIAAEVNPYYYKLPPGYYPEVLVPLWKELLLGVRELLEKEGELDPSRRKRFDELLQKIEMLLQGGYVGKPRVKL